MSKKRSVVTILSVAVLAVFSALLFKFTPASSLGVIAKGIAQPTPVSTPAAPHPRSVTDAAKGLQAQVESVYQKAGDSVVNITTQTTAYDFFMNAVPQKGTGSGFVYDDKGHIVTNFHVVENADKIVVTLADGRAMDAKVVGKDPSNDLAVLQIRPQGETLRPIPLGDSDVLHVGQFVVAIGNPFGLNRTLTFGVISSLGRVIKSPDGRFIGQAIQTDAAINPGNSGGPLLDLQGRVVGINSQIISPSRANAGIGFAIPINTVKRVVPELIETGHYRHPWIGAELMELTAQRAKVLSEAGVKVPQHGLLILKVLPGSPAAKAGLRGGQRIKRIGDILLPVDGDVLVAINGHKINSFQDLVVYLETRTRVGETVHVRVLRSGKVVTLPVTLQDRPMQRN